MANKKCPSCNNGYLAVMTNGSLECTNCSYTEQPLKQPDSKKK
jgi:hypothetical protein